MRAASWLTLQEGIEVVSHHGVERCSNRTQRWVVRRWRRARAAITDVGWPLPCLMGKAIVVRRGARGSASMARVTRPSAPTTATRDATNGSRPRLEQRRPFCQPFDGGADEGSAKSTQHPGCGCGSGLDRSRGASVHRRNCRLGGVLRHPRCHPVRRCRNDRREGG
jgi:hypothetical protein